MAAEASRSGASADSYIGSLISLTSKSEIRYEGVLYNINTEESSIGLCNVQSFGTEGRKKDGPQILASDKIYEYILFRGSDIKDLQVKSSPPPQPAPIHNDPAIIQSQYSRPAPMPVPMPAPMPAPAPAPAPSSLPSFGSGTASDCSNTAQSGVARPSLQGGLPPYQPGGNLASWGSTPPPMTANGTRLAIPPMYWQGYYAPSGGMPHLQAPPMLRPSGLPGPPMQQPVQYPTALVPSASPNLTENPSPLLPPVSSTQSLTSTLPSLVPTQASVLASNPASMFAPNQATVLAPNPASVLAPNQAGVFVPNQAGVFAPNQAGILAPSQGNVSAPSQASVLPPTQGNVPAPSHASVLAPETLSSMLPNKPPAASLPAITLGPNMQFVPPLSSNLDSVSNVSQSLPSIVGSMPRPVHSTSIPHQTPSLSVNTIASSSISSQVETSMPLANPGQLLQPVPSSLPLSQPSKMIHKEVDTKPPEAKVKASSSEPAPAEAKEPILPLPTPIDRRPNGSALYTHQSNRGRGRGRGNGYQRPITKFTEDFDFTAMNEKFKKDEVWGHLGKSTGSSKDREGDVKDDEVDDEENVAEDERIGAKPVYVKDDFFDSLSSNTLDHGSRNGRMKFSEQMKIDTETFGDFPRHRPNRGGGRGPRGGGRMRGSFYGRGYGYVGRGRGHTTPNRAS